MKMVQIPLSFKMHQQQYIDHLLSGGSGSLANISEKKSKSCKEEVERRTSTGRVQRRVFHFHPKRASAPYRTRIFFRLASSGAFISMVTSPPISAFQFLSQSSESDGESSSRSCSSSNPQEGSIYDDEVLVSPVVICTDVSSNESKSTSERTAVDSASRAFRQSMSAALNHEGSRPRTDLSTKGTFGADVLDSHGAACDTWSSFRTRNEEHDSSSSSTSSKALIKPCLKTHKERSSLKTQVRFNEVVEKLVQKCDSDGNIYETRKSPYSLTEHERRRQLISELLQHQEELAERESQKTKYYGAAMRTPRSGLLGSGSATSSREHEYDCSYDEDLDYSCGTSRSATKKISLQMQKYLSADYLNQLAERGEDIVCDLFTGRALSELKRRLGCSRRRKQDDECREQDDDECREQDDDECQDNGCREQDNDECREQDDD